MRSLIQVAFVPKNFLLIGMRKILRVISILEKFSSQTRKREAGRSHASHLYLAKAITANAKKAKQEKAGPPISILPKRPPQTQRS